MGRLIDDEKVKDMIKNHRSDFSTENDYRTARVCVNATPSEEPELKWILCSERQPENSGYYIVTKIETENCEIIDYLWYSTMYGWQYYKSPIAWMQLPEPYMGDMKGKE